MVSVKVWVNSRGQAFVTIPKALFDALGWKDRTEVDWEIMGKDKIKLERVKNGSGQNVTGGLS